MGIYLCWRKQWEYGIRMKEKIFFHQCFIVFYIQIFVSLGKNFPRYFILFITMVNGNVSLISIFSLLVHGDARDFCVLILYPATLLQSLINPNNFLVVSLGFSIQRLMSPANSESFTYFSIWIPFIPFSSLIAVAKTSKTMFNSSGESGHACLVPDFRGNAFNFLPLRIMFAVGLLQMAFIMLSYVPSVPAFLESFLFF